MSSRRLPATLVALLALVLVPTSVAGSASAADPVPSQPTLCDGDTTNGEAPVGSNAPTNRPVAEGDYFSFPNTSTSDRMAIRNRVLDTINSTNGTYCSPTGTVDPLTSRPVYELEHGSVKVATWSFNDWDVANALKAAKRRGASVQAIAARSINQKERYQPWIASNGARQALGYHRGDVPGDKLNDEWSWAHDCSGACRGGGTAHSKYFLFDDVGKGHVRNIVMQTSMNLTRFAYKGQWNQATVWRNGPIYDSFRKVFYESARELNRGYAKFNDPRATSIFFPLQGHPDPAKGILNSVSCAGGTEVRVINYAIYDERGVALARDLRELWDRGCDVRIIYSISSRNVLGILRARAGRGPVPMKQSVIRNRRGDVVKYNHSKWVSVGGSVLAGSSNWSNASLDDDEQMQEFSGSGSYRTAFNKTWNQGSSKPPRTGRLGANFRLVPEEPRWGQGELQYLTPEG